MDSSLLLAPRRQSKASWRKTAAALVISGVALLGAAAYMHGDLLASPVRMRYNRNVAARAAVGDAAPEFSLPSASGKAVSLSSFRGPFGLEQLSKPVVVYFYGGQGSPSCTKQAEAFARAYPDFKKAGAEVLGVSRDSVDFSKDWKAEKELPFPLLSDAEGKIRDAYGIKKDFFGALDGRETYVIGRDGKIKMKFNNQFDVDAHVDKALSALEGL
mmetsp:Transcript_24207/g.47427  ORF Transcript_24207/g.47427 Transcript_24207/m.47427 type:complete len:215 (+) Transcript_24207:2-646(+)